MGAHREPLDAGPSRRLLTFDQLHAVKTDVARAGLAALGPVEEALMVGKHPKRFPRPGVDRAGRTSLHYAAGEGSVAEVTRLLGSGADPNAQDDDGWSPLHFAAQANSVEVVRALITAGANVDARDSYGNTPLFRAVFSYKGDGAVIAILRDAGAQPHAENFSGVAPLSLARTIANTDVARCFADLP